MIAVTRTSRAHPGGVDSTSDAVLVTPNAADENAIVVKSPNDDWGDEAVVAYGKGQMLVLLREDYEGAVPGGGVATEPDRNVLFRVSRTGAVGTAGGAHFATGLRQRGDFTANQSVWIDPTTDCIGVLIDAASDSPATSYLLARTNSGTAMFEVKSTGLVSANRGLDVLSGAAATSGALRMGRTAVEAGVTVQGSGTALLAAAAAGDLLLHNFGAARNVLIGAGVSGEQAAIRVAFTSPNSKLGFFGTAPIVKPTGVAVDATGIHAALVSLGLIAA